MKILFLDVDGVLNNNLTRTRTFDGWCFVEILVDHTNPNENNIPDCDKGIIITVI